MIRPDLRPICENMLMAEGFVKARALAVKFVTLYSLSSELLSKQVIYIAFGFLDSVSIDFCKQPHL